MIYFKKNIKKAFIFLIIISLCGYFINLNSNEFIKKKINEINNANDVLADIYQTGSRYEKMENIDSIKKLEELGVLKSQNFIGDYNITILKNHNIKEKIDLNFSVSPIIYYSKEQKYIFDDKLFVFSVLANDRMILGKKTVRFKFMTEQELKNILSDEEYFLKNDISNKNGDNYWNAFYSENPQLIDFFNEIKSKRVKIYIKHLKYLMINR